MGLERAGNSVYPVFGIVDGHRKASEFVRRIGFDNSATVASSQAP